MAELKLAFQGGESSLDVRRFQVYERVSGLFMASVWARSPRHDIDLETILGKPAQFHISSGLREVADNSRQWSGVCSFMEQVKAETTGSEAHSTYFLRIVPKLWLLTQQTGYRIFQHVTIVDIVEQMLEKWHVRPVWNVDRSRYKKLEYKVQYGESDYAFVCRLLEEAGICFTFPDNNNSRVTFWDKIQENPPRAGEVPYVDNPNEAAQKEFVTRVQFSHAVRPGAFTIADYDRRRPSFTLSGEAPKGASPEAGYEQYRYAPGAALMDEGQPAGTPTADDKGTARHDQPFLKERATRELEALRADQCMVNFDSNVLGLAPGVVFRIGDHPHGEVGKPLLVTELTTAGNTADEWSAAAEAVHAERPYRPKVLTPKPTVHGVQSATVVGPAGEEIHTDEFGRVRVQFPWWREGKSDDNSSCWIRVSQGWAGTGFGLINLPRIGQEVLVSFLAGDPDQPMVTGRVFNATQPVPYKLPEHKTRSTWKSCSSPGGEGFNELMFEDLKGKELIYIQAEKNLRKLVKNDETITVGHDRQKWVKNDEFETTDHDRTEITGNDRTEITQGNRYTVIGKNRKHFIGGDEFERSLGNHQRYVGKSQDIVIMQTRRERIEGDDNLVVKGDRREKVDGNHSLMVFSDRHEKVDQSYALSVDDEIHIKSGTQLVVEASDITIAGPAGFIRLDGGGITIKGSMVYINSGGTTAGKGSGCDPVQPDDATEADFEPPEPYTPDDVAKRNFGTEHPDR